MSGFKHVQAPFDGVITQRNVDVGNLINAGGGGVALFTMAKTDPLRVFIDVPQAYSRNIAVGAQVEVRQTEIPDQVFHGVVSRIAGAIDVATRSQRVELTLPNSDGRLSPGAYVRVSLPLPPKGALSIPANTLLFRAEGPNVAVLDDAGAGAFAAGDHRQRSRRVAGNRAWTWPRGSRHRQSAGFAGRGRPDHSAMTPDRPQVEKAPIRSFGPGLFFC